MVKKNKKGFTLIELLVVIAIIGLLMAIIMPSLQKAKLSVEEVVCRSNLRQYGLAGKMYLDDYDQTFPNAWDSIFKSRDETDAPRACQWHDAARHPDVRPDLAGTLWDYITGAKKVHLCPTFARFARSGDPHPGHDDSVPIEPQFCYSMNAFLGGSEEGNTEYNVRMGQVRTPTRVFYFAEENGWTYTPSETDSFYPSRRYEDALNDNALCGGPALPYYEAAWTDYPLDETPPYKDCFGSFHKTTMQNRNSGMANAVFIDGHVELVEPDRTFYYSLPMDRPPKFD